MQNNLTADEIHGLIFPRNPQKLVPHQKNDVAVFGYGNPSNFEWTIPNITHFTSSAG
jgi:hypothetical protein